MEKQLANHQLCLTLRDDLTLSLSMLETGMILAEGRAVLSGLSNLPDESLDFTFAETSSVTPLGRAQRLTASARFGVIQQTLTIDGFAKWPDAFILQWTFENVGDLPLKIDSLAAPRLTLGASLRDRLWTMQGAAVKWGQDFAFPLPDGFERDNYLGHRQNGEGGGISINLDFRLLFTNSFFISIMITLGQLLTCAMGAFCFAVVKFKGREVLFTALLATMLIPFHVTLIPNFIIFSWLNLIGTSVPLWLPAFWGGAFGTFLIRQYFLTIPRDLVDAARVDGATLPDIFLRIYMPMARPALAALAIFTFQGAWNDLLHPLIYMPAAPNTTLTVGLAFFQQQMSHGGKFTVLMSGAFISILPLLLIFFIAQKQFIEGVALSGVKR